MQRPIEELFEQLSKRNNQQAEELLTGDKAKKSKTSEEHLNSVWALLADKEERR